MGKTTRREFIQKSGFTLVTVGISGRAFMQHTNFAANSALTAAAALSDTGNILLVIQMAGGNDGLNTVVPLATSQYDLYKKSRPTLAIPQSQALPLNSEVGLHPKLAKFKGLFDAKKLAVVQGVGYPNPNRSHFRSMDIWHSANPDKLKYTGWLGDYFDINFHDNTNPLIGASVAAGSLPRSLLGTAQAIPAIASISTYKIDTDPRFPLDGQNNQIPAFLALNREARPQQAYYEQIRRIALDAYASSTTLQAGATRYPSDPSMNTAYQVGGGLGQALKQCAQIIAGDLGARILYVMIGGFDTHQGQDANFAGQQSNLFVQLSGAVDAFLADLTRLKRADNVLIMTWSEFGRRVGENSDRGTDHGAAAPLFLAGNRVKSGVIGNHPSLANLDSNGDVKFAIDFRQVYATVLERWLGVDSRDVLGAAFPLLDFVL